MLEKLKEFNKLLEQYIEVIRILDRFKCLNDAPQLEPLKKVAGTLNEVIIEVGNNLINSMQPVYITQTINTDAINKLIKKKGSI